MLGTHEAQKNPVRGLRNEGKKNPNKEGSTNNMCI
jgi:hypothetical protein